MWKNKGDKTLFLFDYGDERFFVVELVGHGIAEQNLKYPRVIKSAGKASKQYGD